MSTNCELHCTVFKSKSKSGEGPQDKMVDENLINVYPMPARDIINVELPDDFVTTGPHISIHSMYGNLLQSTEPIRCSINTIERKQIACRYIRTAHCIRNSAD